MTYNGEEYNKFKIGEKVVCDRNKSFLGKVYTITNITPIEDCEYYSEGRFAWTEWYIDFVDENGFIRSSRDGRVHKYINQEQLERGLLVGHYD